MFKPVKPRRLPVVAAVCLIAAAGVSPAWAGPIPPPPLGPLPVAGESDLPSFIFPLTSDVTIDWMVLPYVGGLLDGGGDPIPAGGYLYMYQIENTSAVALDALSLTMPEGATATIVAAGKIAGDDLDVASAIHPAHAATVGSLDDAVPGPFPGLATEEGPFPLVPVLALLTTVNHSDHNVTWTFSPQAAGTEAQTLFYISSQPPTYGNAVAQDSTPPSPWGSLAPGGDKLPVPIPEPGTLMLLASAAGALLVPLRRRRSS